MFICDFTPCISDRVLHCVIGLSIQGFTRCNMTVYTQYARDKHGKVVVHVQLMKYTKNWTKNQNTWWVVYLITTLNICRFRRKLDHLAFRSAQDCIWTTKNRDKNRTGTKSLVLRFWTFSKETVIQCCPRNKTKSTVSLVSMCARRHWCEPPSKGIRSFSRTHTYTFHYV